MSQQNFWNQKGAGQATQQGAGSGLGLHRTDGTEHTSTQALAHDLHGHEHKMARARAHDLQEHEHTTARER